MKNFILVLLLFVSTMGYAQESESKVLNNHAFRLYAGFGSGYPILTGLLGMSYAYETGGALSRSFFGVSLDTQVGAIMAGGGPNDLFSGTFNIQSSVGVGKRYEHGGRLFYDIIGAGYSLVVVNDLIQPVQSSILINVLSFHYTDKSGFYFSWRNNFTAPLTVGYKDVGDGMQVPSMLIEWRTYITIGFDFSKLYNPRVYEKRSF